MKAGAGLFGRRLGYISSLTRSLPSLTCSKSDPVGPAEDSEEVHPGRQNFAAEAPVKAGRSQAESVAQAGAARGRGQLEAQRAFPGGLAPQPAGERRRPRVETSFCVATQLPFWTPIGLWALPAHRGVLEIRKL